MGNSQASEASSAASATAVNAATYPINLTDEQWRKKLSNEQYRVLREKGTERAGTGVYNKHVKPGVYRCAGCAATLYTSTTKFDSGCGWPAFYAEVPGTITRHTDRSGGMLRIEIVCSQCGGHMGHEFKGERFGQPIDARHCVNSVAIAFDADEAARVEADAKIIAALGAKSQQ